MAIERGHMVLHVAIVVVRQRSHFQQIAHTILGEQSGHIGLGKQLDQVLEALLVHRHRVLQLLLLLLQLGHLGRLGAVRHVPPIGQIERLTNGHRDVGRQFARDEHEASVRVVGGIVGIVVVCVDGRRVAVRNGILIVGVGFGDETIYVQSKYAIVSR